MSDFHCFYYVVGGFVGGVDVGDGEELGDGELLADGLGLAEGEALGDGVGLIDLVGRGLPVVGGTVVGCGTTVLGEADGVLELGVTCEGVRVGELIVPTVLPVSRPAWSPICPLRYRPAAAATAHSAAVRLAVTTRLRPREGRPFPPPASPGVRSSPPAIQDVRAAGRSPLVIPA